MRVGFTGTREGMTGPQFVAFVFALPAGMKEFVHGCCVGADEEAAVHVNDDFLPRPTIFGKPCDLRGMVSGKAVAVCDEVADPEPPLNRNVSIVRTCDLLIAAPKDLEEEQRSGTWMTVRYARKHGKPIVIVWPDGNTTSEGGRATAPDATCEPELNP